MPWSKATATTVRRQRRRLNVYGTVLAQGTTTDRIAFTWYRDDSYGGDTNGDGVSSTPAANDWVGIQFNADSDGSVINHADIAYTTSASTPPTRRSRSRTRDRLADACGVRLVTRPEQGHVGRLRHREQRNTRMGGDGVSAEVTTATSTRSPDRPHDPQQHRISRQGPGHLRARPLGRLGRGLTDSGRSSRTTPSSATASANEWALEVGPTSSRRPLDQHGYGNRARRWPSGEIASDWTWKKDASLTPACSTMTKATRTTGISRGHRARRTVLTVEAGAVVKGQSSNYSYGNVADSTSTEPSWRRARPPTASRSLSTVTTPTAATPTATGSRRARGERLGGLPVNAVRMGRLSTAPTSPTPLTASTRRRVVLADELRPCASRTPRGPSRHATEQGDFGRLRRREQRNTRLTAATASTRRSPTTTSTRSRRPPPRSATTSWLATGPGHLPCGPARSTRPWLTDSRPVVENNTIENNGDAANEWALEVRADEPRRRSRPTRVPAIAARRWRSQARSRATGHGRRTRASRRCLCTTTLVRERPLSLRPDRPGWQDAHS